MLSLIPSRLMKKKLMRLLNNINNKIKNYKMKQSRKSFKMIKN